MELSVDQSLCVPCDECLLECPSGAVWRDERDGRYHIDHNSCIRCSHCAAVCPPGAVRSDAGSFPGWRDPHLESALVRDFLCGKRSVRRYRPEPIPRTVLDDIIQVGSLTATASNAQDWQAVVVTGQAVREVAAELFAFYLPLVRLASHPLVKPFLRFTDLRGYAKRKGMFERYEQRLLEFEKGDDPFLFHASAVVILTFPRRNRRYGRVNCVLAGQAMMYYAQALGIGSCMIGFMETALNLRGKLRRKVGLPRSRKPGLVFTLGVSDVAYRRLPLRGPLPVSYLDSVSSRD